MLCNTDLFLADSHGQQALQFLILWTELPTPIFPRKVELRKQLKLYVTKLPNYMSPGWDLSQKYQSTNTKLFSHGKVMRADVDKSLFEALRGQKRY